MNNKIVKCTADCSNNINRLFSLSFAWKQKKVKNIPVSISICDIRHRSNSPGETGPDARHIKWRNSPCRRHRRLTRRLATLAKPRVSGPGSNENNGFLRLVFARMNYPCVCVWLLYFQMTINYARKSQQMIAHTLRNIYKFATPRPTRL